MPPFGEIYRLIENSGALVVCEEIDMGITNINYDLDLMKNKLRADGPESALKYMLESVDMNSSSCIKNIDIESLQRKIDEFNVDAVINFSFRNCEIMQSKTNRIHDAFKHNGIPSHVIEADYLEFFEKESELVNEIMNFLNP